MTIHGAGLPWSMRTVVTIGNFDGVHRGHASLVRRARELAGSGGRVVAMTFEPHPAAVLRPEGAPPRIVPFSRRVELLRACGADEVEPMDPRGGVLECSAEDFVRGVVARHRPSAFVEGPDFHFGKRRAGNVRVLAEFGRVMGFVVDVAPPVEATLPDGMVVTASSSLVRWLVSHGRVADAAAVLGRAFELAGEVVPGDRLGRRIGFPTANVRWGGQQLLPADGVYAGRAELPTGESVQAMVNVGTRPTVSGVDRRVETHLIREAPAWSPWPGLPEYGWPIVLRVERWLRDQVRFPGVPALVEQLGRDRQRVRSGC